MPTGPRESEPAEPQNAEALALKLLMRRMLSRSELTTRLLKLGCDKDAIAAAVSRCEAWGYINDGRLAEMLAQRAVTKRCGTRKLALWGRTSGIDERVMQPAIDTLRANEASALRAQVERRFPDALQGTPLEPKRRAKIIRHLVGRGFSAALVMRVLGRNCEFEPLEEDEDC